MTEPGSRADVSAAGAVLWRPGPAGPEVAVVHRPRYDDWSLPKGKLDRGETMPFAAAREVAEETGFGCRLGPALGVVMYAVPEGEKVVRYWAAQACQGSFVPNAETDDLRWLDVGRARKLVTYDRDEDVLVRFAGLGPVETVLLLVRHGKAGDRAGWSGPDDARPLDADGADQARDLVGLLALFGPERVHSAPPLRCVATVGPLAEAVGQAVAEEPVLGEEGYWDDPDAGLARLLEIAGSAAVSVVCSQGGVIPDVVGELAERAGLVDVVLRGRDKVAARKASTWVLGLRGGRLVSADYYRTPDGADS